MRPPYYNPLTLNPPNADTLSLALIPPQTKVLEMGCNSGYLGRVLKKEKRCRVYGVDTNHKAITQARKVLDKAILANIESTDTIARIKSYAPFDIIFASAILEHLVNPIATIQRMKPLLKKNGAFVITLPNVAHWTIRSQLLSGQFNPTDSGILDKTHLHFYTLSMARKLLKEAGLEIMYENYEYFGPKIMTPFFHFFPNLFTYQIIFLAKPTHEN